MVFHVHDDVAGAAARTLRLKLVGTTIHDRFDVVLNGEAIEADRIERLHAPGGRDTRVDTAPLEAYSLMTVEPAER